MEQIKDLQEIQMEIKKELKGASLNHLLQYTYFLIDKRDSFLKKRLFECYSYIIGSNPNCMILKWEKWENPLDKKIFVGNFIFLNEQKQALNIFGQSEDFQRKLYEAIQIIKNINFKQ